MAEYRFEWGGEKLVVLVEATADGYAVTLNGVTHFVTVTQARPGELDLAWEDERRLTAWVASAGSQRWVALATGPEAGHSFELSVPQPAARRRTTKAGGSETLAAQMPGVVRRVLVTAGEQVARGQTLVVLEAMKMEIRINAPEAGRVTAVSVNEGQSVDRSQRLVDLAPLA